MPFKTCPTCGTDWSRFEDMLRDQDLVLTGYQASFSKAVDGLFLLTHECINCGSTLAIKVEKLADLYSVERYPELKYDTDACEKHCVNFDDLEPCGQECSMRWVREILVMIRKRIPPLGEVSSE